MNRPRVVGTLLFSGSLYLIVRTGIGGFGAITPFGGTAWLVGWGVLVWAGLGASKKS